jgi:hypothetical protein
MYNGMTEAFNRAIGRLEKRNRLDEARTRH